MKVIDLFSYCSILPSEDCYVFDANNTLKGQAAQEIGLSGAKRSCDSVRDDNCKHKVPFSELHDFVENESTGTKWAILVAGSKGYQNYRHQANICHAYQILKKGGIKDENVIVFMFDDIADNERNPYKGVIVNEEDGPDVYKGVPKDYTGDDVTAENLYNVLLGEQIRLTGRNGKILKSGPCDNIFFYFSGHGNRRCLGMPQQGDKVRKNKFINILKTMHQNKSYNKMVIYIESCFSGSMFADLLPDDLNIYAVTSANPDQKSFSCYKIEKMGKVSLGGRFSVAWMKNSECSDLDKLTLDEQFEEVKHQTASYSGKVSEVSFYGTRKLGETLVGDFLTSSPK